VPNYYPPVGFHFKVEVGTPPHNDDDVRFSEVSGLSVEMGTEEVPEGGENRFVQKYPTRPKYPDLVLKRGLLTNSEILTWIRECIENLNITPKEVFVKLLDEEHLPLMTWHLVGAFPTKWAVSDFNASNSAVVIESLQMYYQYFTVKLGRG
jgi:phage tail-like protein